jgi:predicted methyltransferase
MRRTIRNPRCVLLVGVAGLLVGCGDGYDEPVEPTAVDAWPLAASIKPAVDDPLRPEEDRARDADRRPAEVLAFFGIGEGMRVADLQATVGYYTETLSSVVGPAGRVYAQNNNFVLEGFAEKGLTERLAKLQEAGRANVTRVDAELDEMELPPHLDAVLFVRFYHDLFWLPTPDGNLNDRPEFLRRVYEALKPGGVFGVVDHHAEAGSEERDALDPEEGLHRIDVELVKREILAAGFVLDAESDVLANPEDTRDWNIFIEERTRRDTTDRFVLRFMKPEA